MSGGAAPRWITKTAIVSLHDRSLALHGGQTGPRGQGLRVSPRVTDKSLRP